jgi:predicted DsbA family dithiol-disulfide isomerase
VLVEIWSDIACPWCHIGKRRFEAALAQFEHRDEIEILWRSFELDPNAPPVRDGDRAVHLARKYGTTVERAREMQEHMTRVAAGEGLVFRFDRCLGANMLDAHRLLHLAREHGVQDDLEERFFRAYLAEGETMSDHAVLERLAVEVGLEAAEVRETLGGDRFEAEVREDERTAALLGIDAVPFFVVDRAVGAAGAQPPEVLLDLLRRAWSARAPVATAADAPACGPDGCA